MIPDVGATGEAAVAGDVHDRYPLAIELKYLARQAMRNASERYDHVPPHWELIWIVEGDLILRRGGTSERIRPHSVFLTRPGERTQMIPIADGMVSLGVVILYSLPFDDPPPVRHLDQDDIVIGLLEHALWLDTERPAGSEVALERAIAHALWVYVTGASGHIPPTDEFSKPIMRLLLLLRESWEHGPMTPLSLDEMAAAAKVTRVHLCRLFETELGEGPVTAVRLIRIHDAAALLRHGMSVHEAARRTGFTTGRHFSQVFRTVTGVSPTDYRADDEAVYELPRELRRMRAHLFRSAATTTPAST